MDMFEHELVDKLKNIYCNMSQLKRDGGSGITISMWSMFGIDKLRYYNRMILLLILVSATEASALSFISSMW